MGATVMRMVLRASVLRASVRRATVRQATDARLVALLAAAACHSAAPAARSAAIPAADTCTAPTGELPPSATSTRLGGEYRLRLVATAGPRSREAVDAHLRLSPLADSLQVPVPVLGVRDTTTRHPLAGTTDLDPAVVGGVSTGDNASTDPAAPGVLVIERHAGAAGAPARIMLRLGALANRRGLVRFDGGYFALTVRRIDADGFAGTWSSGTAREAAAGYFCAERPGP
jgi:hypothetical protein